MEESHLSDQQWSRYHLFRKTVLLVDQVYPTIWRAAGENQCIHGIWLKASILIKIRSGKLPPSEHRRDGQCPSFMAKGGTSAYAKVLATATKKLLSSIGWIWLCS